MRSDFSWFSRSVRVMPVIAVAALVGGAIGGFSVFAVDTALTALPQEQNGAVAAKPAQTADATKALPWAASSQPDAGSPQTASNPIRTIDGPASASAPVVASVAAPSTAAGPQQAQTAPTAPASTQLQTQAQPAPAVPGPQTPWPDALSRSQPAAPAATEAATPPPGPAAPVVSDARANDNGGSTNGASTAAKPPVAPHSGSATAGTAKTQPAKRRVIVSRKEPPMPATSNNAGDAWASRERPVYDYYGDAGDRYDQDARRPRIGYGAPYDNTRNARNAMPNTRPYARRVIDNSDQVYPVRGAAPLPPPPPPPSFFGGLFGRDY